MLDRGNNLASATIRDAVVVNGKVAVPEYHCDEELDPRKVQETKSILQSATDCVEVAFQSFGEMQFVRLYDYAEVRTGFPGVIRLCGSKVREGSPKASLVVSLTGGALLADLAGCRAIGCRYRLSPSVLRPVLARSASSAWTTIVRNNYTEVVQQSVRLE